MGVSLSALPFFVRIFRFEVFLPYTDFEYISHHSKFEPHELFSLFFKKNRCSSFKSSSQRKYIKELVLFYASVFRLFCSVFFRFFKCCNVFVGTFFFVGGLFIFSFTRNLCVYFVYIPLVLHIY